MRTELVTKLSASDVQMASDAKAIKDQIKKLQSELDAINEHFAMKMSATGAHIGTFRNMPIVEMRPWSRATLNSKRLRLEQPSIAEAYTTTHEGVTPHYV